ncbi:MAG: hypothetical protein M3008_04475 [Chloroflexota bacterium]|nr:hypothetical protein [Chloroflexota bacterium]
MTRWLGYALGTVLLMSMPLAAPVAAADPSYTYTFATHAAFFSNETNQTAVIDPQVFVADPAVAAATGPQNIMHIGGYRPARVASDAPSVPLFTAQGIPLQFTLGEWLGASGTGTVVCTGGATAAINQLSGLAPGGVYQLFRNQFTPQGPKRSPFGKPDASDSVFTASKDGTIVVTSALPFCPDPTDGVLLSYHSDGMVHGPLGGDIGVNIHNQLLIRVAVTLPVGIATPPPTGSRTRLVRRLGDG